MAKLTTKARNKLPLTTLIDAKANRKIKGK